MLATSRRKVIVLVVGGKTFRIDKERAVIGSVASADLRIAGDGVAPIHAVLEVNYDASGEGTATIYDLASDTGVFVNDVKIVTHALRDADVITVGRHRVAFKLEAMGNRGATGASSAGPNLADQWLETGGRVLFLPPGEEVKPLLLEDERDILPIFDYRPAAKQALEVVMSWSDTIIDVGHFTREPSITIGNTRKCDFGIPPLPTAAKHTFATRVGSDYGLSLDSGMKAVVMRGGQLSQVQGPTQLSLGREDFAKVSVGEIDFYVSYTAAPPGVRRNRKPRDPLFFKIFVSSLLLTGLTVMAIRNMQVPHTLEAEQIPERIATILYQPEKYGFKPVPVRATQNQEKVEEQKTPPPPKKPEPKPTEKVDFNKPIPKPTNIAKAIEKNNSKANASRVAQNEAKEGRGARSKGKEGKRGSTRSKNQGKPQDQASRPSPDGGTGRGNGDSQVVDQGNVDILKSASGKIQDLLGNSAAKLGESGAKLKGFGGFTTQGQGGLALSGSGKGGGGNADTLAGGLSDRGKGGGRVGTGMGAMGNGNGIVGGMARVAIRTGGSEEAIVMGSIDADAIEAAIQAHRDEFRLCYEREINAENPSLAGRVGTSFVIGSSGKVAQAGVESSSLKNANAERCILSVIKRIQFPIPRGGGIVQVSYPFKFSAQR